jgi:hypothetical protein
MPSQDQRQAVQRPWSASRACRLASEFWKTPDADLQSCANIRFLAEYAAVDRFAEQLERVLDGECEEAVLKGITN